MTPTIIAIDLTTRVFQFHFVDSDTGAIHSKVLKRAQQQPFFANRRVSRVVMEACGSAHHWARQLAQLGHDVRLIAVQFVRPFRQVDQERCRGRGGNLGSCAASPAARAASTNPSWYKHGVVARPAFGSIRPVAVIRSAKSATAVFQS